MKRRRSIEDDPVADVRRWRARVFKEAGGTLEGLAKLLDEPTIAKRSHSRTKKAPTKTAANGRVNRKRRAA